MAWGQTCVTRLVNLGKDTNCLVMCSGSASVLRAMVFPPSQGPWRRYQGLNHSVYRIKTVLPLRSGEQVMKYVRQRYPHIDIDDDTAQRLFRATGGVVRRIANWARTGDDLDVTAETAAEDTLRILRDSSDPLHHAVTSFACRVFSRYTYSDYDDGDERKMPDSVCLPCSHVASTDFAYGAMDALVDAGIVVVAGGQYEYLVPAVADYVAAELKRDTTALALNAMRTVVCGWEGKGSAAAAAEPLVFQHLVRPQRDTVSIRVVDGTPFVELGGTSTSLSDFGVDNLCGRVVTVAKDTGADGFVLEVDSNWAKKKKKKAQRRFRVTAYQIKLGDFNFKFRAGVLATQRGYSNNSSRDKRTMAGIVACLEVGWQQFSTLLAAAFRDATFVLDSAWLLSNKQLPSNGMTPSHTRVRDGTVRGMLRRRGWVPLHTLCKWEFYAKLPRTVILAVLPHHHATTVLAKLA